MASTDTDAATIQAALMTSPRDKAMVPRQKAPSSDNAIQPMLRIKVISKRLRLHAPIPRYSQRTLRR